jgi:transcriptional regulator PpsR
MNGQAASAAAKRRIFPRGLLGDVDSAVAEKLVAAGGDVAMVIDRDGVIRDIAVSNDDLARDGARTWLDQPWLDTVTVESRPKVVEMLRDADSSTHARWREINQITPANASLMVRYVAIGAGRDGQVIAIGRDERAAAALQKRLMEAQQAMERDYSRLRDAEGRYRLLFRMSGEAVVVVDAMARRIVEANPAAERLLGAGRSAVVGDAFASLFDPVSQAEAASVLAVALSTARNHPAHAELTSRGRRFTVSASVFRQDRASHCLVRLAPADAAEEPAEGAGPDLLAVLERIPDAFLVTDDAMKILTANAAFLDMVRVGSTEQAIGQPLTRFLGRAGLDRNLLLDALREHGSVRNFRTILRNEFGEPEDVEVSGAAAPHGEESVYGFTIRNVERRLNERPHAAPELRRSVEQLTQLVGRMTLKDLVRETTDLVERLCIEAALELTKNNRASAAEVLGLSRQSLYSKLHRFGMGNLAANET